MSNLNLRGIWIPIEVLINKELSDKEKMIYSMILFLSNENKYCYCTNKTISELLDISITQVSKLINLLKEKKYIDVKLIYKENSKQIKMRKLILILKNNNTCLTKLQYPLEQKFKDNNKQINKYDVAPKQKKSRLQVKCEERDYTNFDFTKLYANKVG